MIGLDDFALWWDTVEVGLVER
ncbi:hypothetical protein VCHA43O270_160002 [Vibrio chagasii]|nr:hypothetical protein VCHA34P115_240002 [Vibrio chagasii]CAH6987922.1 hypothetical protein VCHA43O270_160002 [Vibrio chagasii]